MGNTSTSQKPASAAYRRRVSERKTVPVAAEDLLSINISYTGRRIGLQARVNIGNSG
jgi:hypothetical protein